jgi:hypothetical protein
MDKVKQLSYLEWLALANLYQHRDKASSPARYVGLQATITGLMGHKPPLAAWVGKAAQNQIHITPDGVALYEAKDAE